jgi:hypothetical protein
MQNIFVFLNFNPLHLSGLYSYYVFALSEVQRLMDYIQIWYVIIPTAALYKTWFNGCSFNSKFDYDFMDCGQNITHGKFSCIWLVEYVFLN